MSEAGSAKLLAKKMTVLYKLAKEQLGEYHYDSGLRALKSVLVMAGGLKRGEPDLDESTILMRALRDMNMLKFIYADVPLFTGLIGDLFPGLDCRACGIRRSTTRSRRRSSRAATSPSRCRRTR